MLRTDEWLAEMSKDPTSNKREVRVVLALALVGSSAIAGLQLYWFLKWFGGWIGVGVYFLAVALELYLVVGYCKRK
jgi:hypothetical protein